LHENKEKRERLFGWTFAPRLSRGLPPFSDFWRKTQNKLKSGNENFAPINETRFFYFESQSNNLNFY
jgi:hypothetical protein